ncbi:MAG TPA: hypothetical protein DCE56_29565 [Cyanobacteria bacterium UBA8553]|nr:hypothetical protein [Cyanobacteria bacterium UBA8553]
MKTLKILIVDSDIHQQQLHKTLLERRGYICDCVVFLESAIQSLKLFKYDLIISETVLPDGDGIQLKNEVTKLFGYVPIIFTASKLNENLLKPAKGRSLISYLAKPVSTDALFSSIKSALELSAKLNAPQEIPSIAKLKVIDGTLLKLGQEVKEVCLSKTVTLGRRTSDTYCDYQIDDRSVSRHHATFVRIFFDKLIEGSKDCFNLWDGEINGQKSANGCKVNGRRIICQELKHGDIVTIPGLTVEYLSLGKEGCLIDENATLT